MSNFWKDLRKPIIAQAPLADVTDAAFRRLIAKHSANCWTSDVQQWNKFVTWTEFVSADGLMLAPEAGRQKLLADLIYTEAERPIVAQLFSSQPENMEGAARLCAELGFDGIDINMGCPDRSIEKQGCGSAMIKTPAVAKEIIQAAKRGAGDLPVSVKTRIGYYEDEIETWIPNLLEENLAALTVHLRTRQQMSKVPAQWEKMPRIVELRDKLAPNTLILGNGDVLSMEDGRLKAESSGADGVMVGRALFGNPWFFHHSKCLSERMTLSAPSLPFHRAAEHDSDGNSALSRPASQVGTFSNVEVITVEERLTVMVEHTKLFTELLPFKNFAVMKKHYKAYVTGFEGAARLRAALMETNSPKKIETIVKEFISTGRTCD